MAMLENRVSLHYKKQEEASRETPTAHLKDHRRTYNLVGSTYVKDNSGAEMKNINKFFEKGLKHFVYANHGMWSAK